MARLTKKDKLNEMINNYCESHQTENFNYLNVALISYKLTMWNYRVPPGLPAVLQLMGYDLNLREKKEFAMKVHCRVHLQYWDSVTT